MSACVCLTVSAIVHGLLLPHGPGDTKHSAASSLRPAMSRNKLLQTAAHSVAGLAATWIAAAAGAEDAATAEFTAGTVEVSTIKNVFADKTIGQIPASGIIFKDLVKVDRVSDPKVEGVQLYVSDFQRPFTERLQKDFFNDPTQAAVTCVRVGPVKLDPTIDTSPAGEEVFSQARSLLFKSVKVRRLYDPETNAVIYVSYSTRLDKNEDENKSRFKTSMCVVKVD